MTRTTTILCAAASTAALYVASADAAPMSTPLALKSAETQNIEAVRYYRRHHGRWVGGPRAYYGGYNSYAYVPGYGAPRYGGFRRGGHTCSRDEDELYSAYPSWWCSRIRNYQ